MSVHSLDSHHIVSESAHGGSFFVIFRCIYILYKVLVSNCDQATPSALYVYTTRRSSNRCWAHCPRTTWRTLFTCMTLALCVLRVINPPPCRKRVCSTQFYSGPKVQIFIYIHIYIDLVQIFFVSAFNSQYFLSTSEISGLAVKEKALYTLVVHLFVVHLCTVSHVCAVAVDKEDNFSKATHVCECMFACGFFSLEPSKSISCVTRTQFQSQKKPPLKLCIFRRIFEDAFAVLLQSWSYTSQSFSQSRWTPASTMTSA